MLTKREKQVLQLVHSAAESHGKTPSYRALSKILGLSSPATVYKHIKNLKKKGYLEKSPDSRYESARIQPHSQVVIAGSISQGKKITLFSHVTTLLLDYDDNAYGFVVQDSSFSELHILENDLVIVQVSKQPLIGNMVLATNEEGATFIGKLVRQDDLECICCQNAYYIKTSGLQITGVVKAVIRNYNSSSSSSGS